jgi:hypothetical protein
MAFNNDFFMGFVSGTVVGAVGYRMYEQNSGQLNRLIQPQTFGGANTQGNSPIASGYEPTVEELMTQKEKLEDLIAEKNL